jgi:hypothetical protein
MSECTYDPQAVTGPIGMFHCPECGCMQLAGMKHLLPCDPDECQLADPEEQS